MNVFRFPQLQFEYKDPEKNFDRRSVHGLVATLLEVKDARNATALEVVAGGRVRIISGGWSGTFLKCTI